VIARGNWRGSDSSRRRGRMPGPARCRLRSHDFCSTHRSRRRHRCLRSVDGGDRIL
jgi:hypothetical protein